MAETDGGARWWRSFVWIFGVSWGVAAAFAITIAFPYGQAVFVPTMLVCSIPLILIAFVAPLGRSLGAGAGVFFVLVCVAGLGYSAFLLHEGAFPSEPAAAGSAAEDARYSLGITVRDASDPEAEYRDYVRVSATGPIDVTVRVQNLSYEVAMRNATLEIRAVPEQGGIVRFIAKVSSPGFSEASESATVQSLWVSPAEATIEPGTIVYLAVKTAKDASTTIPLDEIDSLPQTWHLPAIPKDVEKDTVWVTLRVTFTASALPPVSPTPSSS